MEQISKKTINHFLSSHKLFPHKILVGVSGGMDSMVLLHLLNQLDIPIAVAHCNFSLRGMESDKDEESVSTYCNDNNITLYTKRFDTNQHSQTHSVSIEMAARDLRYGWFEELSNEFDFDYIAIAHNLNDSIETFFLNLTRGSGIKGLTGISPINGKIIRPLIDLSRENIADYAQENKIPWRMDASNLTTVYRRNFIRHNILPQFVALNPSFISTMQRNLAIMSGASRIIELHASEEKAALLSKQGSVYHINISELTAKLGWETLLFEILNEFGLSSGEYELAKGILFAQTGSRVVTNSYTIWKNRENLVIKPNIESPIIKVIIESPNGAIGSPIKLNWISTHLNATDAKWQSNQGVFEVEKLTFPLTIRNWRAGDSFIPSGMTGAKKISDFLTDQNIESQSRNSIIVMESDGKIAWVIGLRVSELFRKTGKTGTAIIFTLD